MYWLPGPPLPESRPVQCVLQAQPAGAILHPRIVIEPNQKSPDMTQSEARFLPWEAERLAGVDGFLSEGFVFESEEERDRAGSPQRDRCSGVFKQLAGVAHRGYF